MDRIDLIRKLSSRKFWALITAFVTSALVFSGAGAETIERTIALVGAFSAIIVYTLAEANIDAHRIDATAKKEVHMIDTGAVEED